MKRKTLLCPLLAVLVLALSAVVIPNPVPKYTHDKNIIMVADDLQDSEHTTKK